MVTLIQFARSSKDKLIGFTHLTLVDCPSRLLIVCLMCNTMIQLAACDDGGLDSTTDQSVSGIFCGQSVTGTGFSASTEVFPCHYHSTSIPYSDFICVLLTLYSPCSWQLHSVTLKQQCLSVCHLVMMQHRLQIYFAGCLRKLPGCKLESISAYFVSEITSCILV